MDQSHLHLLVREGALTCTGASNDLGRSPTASEHDRRDTMNVRDATILHETFNPHAPRYIVLIDYDPNGMKRVATRNEPPPLDAFAQHVRSESKAGPGAIGISPVIATHAGGGRPHAAFSTIDIDQPVDDATLAAVILLLETHDINVYLSTGTTGRGMHLHMLFTEPVSQSQSFALAGRVAALLNPEAVQELETFPSGAKGVGNGILMPYRGCEEDGFGANPWLDPWTTQPIPIHRLEALERTTPLAVERFLASVGGPLGTLDGSIAGGPLPAAEFDVHAELRRLAEVWTLGRRQYLAIGFAAVARFAGWPLARARGAVRQLEAAGPGPHEFERRDDAVRRTYDRWEFGHLIAYRPFYLVANVPPPQLTFVDPEVLSRLKLIDDAPLAAYGRRAPSARRILHHLERLANCHGRTTPDGVRVNVSRRDLAHRSNLTLSTVESAVTTLRAAGIVKPLPRCSRDLTHAGGFEIIIAPMSVHSSQSPLAPLGGQNECTDIEHHALFTQVGRGRAPGQVLASLMRGGPQTRRELMNTTGCSLTTVDRAVRRLLIDPLVEETSQGASTRSMTWMPASHAPSRAAVPKGDTASATASRPTSGNFGSST